MTLWILLMASLFVCTALGTLYLIRRFSRFSFVSKPSGNKKSISYLISAAILAVAFAYNHMSASSHACLADMRPCRIFAPEVTQKGLPPLLCRSNCNGFHRFVAFGRLVHGA